MIAQIITVVATLATAVMTVRARHAVRQTTLTTAWAWALIAAASWCVAAAASLFLVPAASAVGQLWYVAAVLALCPWIAVLGARRPTIRVWNWFVVVPLVAVLLWPVALCWMPRGPDRLILEAPHLVGFGLVLVMGSGNYLGTRFTGSAIMTVLAQIILIASLGSSHVDRGSVAWFAAAAACLLFTATLSAFHIRRRHDDKSSVWDVLWRDFRDTFGIVWANRIAERVNDEAAKSNWIVRLQPHGFVSTALGQKADVSIHASQIDHTLRWLLRRFVDDEWINSRLQAHAAPGLNEGGSLAGNDSIDASSTLS